MAYDKLVVPVIKAKFRVAAGWLDLHILVWPFLLHML